MSKQARVYRIVWDNGLNASDEFPYEFATEQEARAYGESWATEMNSMESDYSGYTFYVIEAEPLPKSVPPKPRIWTACIQKSIVGPIVSRVRQRKHRATSEIPSAVAEFLEVQGDTRKLSMSNEQLDEIQSNTNKGYYRATDGDICKVTRRYHGMRVWVTFKLVR